MDRFVAMQAFLRVVDTGSFTAASEALGIPKATLTRGVQELETHLRTQLLNRTTRRVSVTPDGALYYERARRLLVELDEMEGSEIDLAEIAREQILLDLPQQFFCKDDCKGLCEKCGTNLNLKDCDCEDDEIDPRWAALKNLN